MPEMWPQHDDPSWPLWRVHDMQRLPGLQVREAEFHRCEVPALQRWRTGGEAGPQREHFLWVRKLSKMQIHLGAQANCREVSELWERVSGREVLEGRSSSGLPEQGV